LDGLAAAGPQPAINIVAAIARAQPLKTTIDLSAH
jgi:hypothetical protein